MASLGDEKTREQYLQNLRDGMARGSAGEALQLTRAQVFGYIAENAMFAMRVEDAEGEATEHIEEAMWQAAASGNVSAMKMWLDRRDQRMKRRDNSASDLQRALGGESEAEPSETSTSLDGIDDVDDFLRKLDGTD